MSRTKKKLLVIFIFLFIGVNIYLLDLYFGPEGRAKRSDRSRVSQTEKSPNPSPSPIPQPAPEFQEPMPSPVSVPTLDEILKESIKPKIEVDASSWEIYENSELGIRFRYPSEWGEPDGELQDGYNEDSKRFELFFSNSSFTVAGNSPNWSANSGPHFSYYSGRVFGCGEVNFGLSCEIKNGRTYVLNSLFCGYHGDSYLKLMYVPLSGRSVGGLVFGGHFLSPSYEVFASCPDSLEGKIKKDALDKAILERRLDEEIIKNIDTYDKVSETLEVY